MADTDKFHKAMNSIKPMRRIGIFILAFCIFLLSQLLLGMSLKTMLSMLPQIGALSPEIKEALEKTRNDKTLKNSSVDEFYEFSPRYNLPSSIKRCASCIRTTTNNNNDEINYAKNETASTSKDDDVRDMAISTNITTGINLIGSE